MNNWFVGIGVSLLAGILITMLGWVIPTRVQKQFKKNPLYFFIGLTVIIFLIVGSPFLIRYLQSLNLPSTAEPSSETSSNFTPSTGNTSTHRKDVTPPIRSITHSPQNPISGDQITFVVEASDENGISKIELYVNWDNQWHLVRTSYDSTKCEWIGTFYSGLIGYNGIAYDMSGNSYPGSPGQWERYLTVP